MTKSEAKAIQQRAGRAYRILSGAENSSDQVPVKLSNEIVQNPAIAAARDAVFAILEMALVELGGK